MIIDATLYVLIGILTALSAALSTDDAAKHIDPVQLWWAKTWTNSALGGCLSLKMFRSDVFSRWKANGQAKTNGNGNGNGHTTPAMPPAPEAPKIL